MTILITNQNHDITTSYLYYYTKEINDFAIKEIGSKPLYLEGSRLNRQTVTSIIKDQNPKLVLLNGHGDHNKIFGNKIYRSSEPEVIFEGDVNHSILSRRLIYARSCWAGKSLGPKIVSNRGCFIGYVTPFEFWNDENLSTNPAKDKTAYLFLDPSNEVARSLIKGIGASESAEKFKVLCKKNILKLLNNNQPG